jgi:CcmD family protein
MNGGTIAGGWQFVVAAYTVTGIILFGYLASLFARLRGERTRPETQP